MTAAARKTLELTLFLEATETAFQIADQLHDWNPAFPAPPRRRGVANAGEIHQRLLSGQNPIAAMSLDDAISLRHGPDPAGHDLMVIAGVHRGFLELMVQPEIDGVNKLSQRRVGIDTETGYARALLELLRQAGLHRRRDVRVVEAGATNLRYERLLAGDIDGTLLGSPFTDLAKARGFHSLGSVPQLLGGYQGVVLLAKDPWLQANAEQARALILSLQTAIRWAMDPAHRQALIPMLQRCVKGAQEADLASRIAESLFGASSEYLVDGRIRSGDLAVVVDLYNRAQGTHLLEADVQAWISKAYLPS